MLLSKYQIKIFNLKVYFFKIKVKKELLLYQQKMLTADFCKFNSSEAQNFKQIQSASILLWRNKLKQSAVLPILILRSQVQNIKNPLHQNKLENRIQTQDNRECLQKDRKIQNIYLQWNQLASILQQQGPLGDFKLLVQDFHQPTQKMKFKVIINDKEKLIISASWQQSIGELCDKILISFFSTFIYSEQQFNGVLAVENLPVQINKLKINNKMVCMKDKIGKVANQNDIISVIFSKKTQIANESQKKILKKYEEYNQKKAKELKEKQKEKSVQINSQKQSNPDQNNNQAQKKSNLSSEDSEMSDYDSFLNDILKKQKVESQSEEESQKTSFKIKCKFILSIEKIYVDLWDQFKHERIKFSICQEESLEDLKMIIEDIIGIESEKIQIVSEVYQDQRLYELDQINPNYELFNQETTSLDYFYRLVGG
ncbi:hypothetical protein TTHERM_00420750 (macronuclear) [Tetrahymena thermophila SB210]|uniref:Uncharacterized protein n=1 Tax=Tetrahymena thermophila (strain SB210) TaxID=312017 RepID=I7MH12_TETTS|nr:hypothetical protein TTHERM_00420750 [Tetrahymena thermophila SB210]EAR85667.2 hypothetical protein TTHERM_00420750 [Tetrahymena thermophila SB210]|eukprot:XP_001033330.2 hypothetical protein TTHERM_00420750 [Tetrahymena thermophila SB210]